MKLLIIRPEPGASASAERAREAGLQPVLLPFFEVQAVAWESSDPADYDAVLLTSANAVRFGGAGLESLRALPVHAVGERTAEAARAAQLDVASVGSSDAAAAVKAASDMGHRRLLWLAGADHRPIKMPKNMPKALKVTTVISYASGPKKLTDDMADVISSADAIALHSARAAIEFAKAVEEFGLDKASITLAAFSPAIADAAGTGWRAVAVAERPADIALLSALADLGKPPKETDDGKEVI
jgi:uroporphyrinogen-III synthase